MSYSYTKIGPFITQAHENGVLLKSSRAMRKEYKLLTQSPKLILTYLIAILFMIGTIFFNFNTFASFVYADSKALNEIMAINYTMFGGVCFFIGAFLLIVEMREQEIAL